MTDYVYGSQQQKFSVRDTLPPGTPDKVVTGSQMDAEFDRLTTVSAEKLNVANPAFTGIMTGGTIDGGLF